MNVLTLVSVASVVLGFLFLVASFASAPNYDLAIAFAFAAKVLGIVAVVTGIVAAGGL